MKTNRKLFAFLMVLLLVQPLARANPLPLYHLTGTCEGLVTDIPGATIAPGRYPNIWTVELSADQHFKLPLGHLRDPSSPSLFTEVGTFPNLGIPGLLWISELSWLDCGFPLDDSVTALIFDSSGPVAEVLLQDSRDAVPDSVSTLGLLIVGLLSLRSLARWR